MVWLYVLIWTTKTGPLCRRFGVLFVENTKLECVGSKTSPGHGSMVLATLDEEYHRSRQYVQ